MSQSQLSFIVFDQCERLAWWRSAESSEKVRQIEDRFDMVHLVNREWWASRSLVS